MLNTLLAPMNLLLHSGIKTFQLGISLNKACLLSVGVESGPHRVILKTLKMAPTATISGS